jgi:hypothetical protein
MDAKAYIIYTYPTYIKVSSSYNINGCVYLFKYGDTSGCYAIDLGGNYIWRFIDISFIDRYTTDVSNGFINNFVVSFSYNIII